MKRLIPYISLYLIACTPGIVSAQDSSHLRISLLTCSPGEELYATFGHSAFRVTDSSSVTDIVYNYGTFNFDEKGFYIKFMRGNLLYYVSAQNFYDFKNDYQADNRGITEQVLNLSPAEKTSIQHFLNNNLKEENKYYKYDFFFDNCTTRLRDIIKMNHDTACCNKAVMPNGTTFRQAIHEYLDRNGQAWSKLGIDVLMGLHCDARMTPEQMEFLPDNLMKSFDSSLTPAPLILSKQNLYPFDPLINKSGPFSPLLVFTILLLGIVGIGFFKNRTSAVFLHGFDGLLFFFTGITGILIILMWGGRDDTMCRDNLNILWALPTHVVVAFFINSRKAWVRKYFGFTTILMIIVLASWYFLPQQMNNELNPLLLLLTFRSYRRWQPRV